MPKPRQKQLTQREKALRASAKKEMQDKGVLPPDKPRLNRRKFAAEVWAEFADFGDIPDMLYLLKAIGCMVGPDMREVSSEAVGVLKTLKIAMETKKFTERLRAEGREQYTVGEYLDTVVLPIIRL